MAVVWIAANDNYTNVRAAPGTKYKVVTVINRAGQRAVFNPKPTYVDNREPWHEVVLDTGQVGFVHAGYVQQVELGVTHRLEKVPYRSQIGAGAEKFPNDCGPACVTIKVDFAYDRPDLTVNQVAIDGGMVGNAFTSWDQLVNVARAYGVGLTKRERVNLPRILHWLRVSNTPVLALIHYGALSGRQSKFAGGHFVVVVGYTDSHVIIHDPNWIGDGGREWQVPLEEFATALAQVGDDGNTPGKALFMEDYPVSGDPRWIYHAAHE